jgi:hypothetical protein
MQGFELNRFYHYQGLFSLSEELRAKIEAGPVLSFHLNRVFFFSHGRRLER